MEGTPSKERLPIEIVRQTPEDAEEITSLLYKAWLATYPNEAAGITVDDVEDRFKDFFSEEAMEARRERTRNLPENKLSLVAKINGRIVGFCDVFREDAANVLRTIYVDPEYHGKGIGGQLWDEAKKFLDKQKGTVVEVADYNQNAINFYKSKGFEDTGARHQDERFRMKSGAIITEMEMKRPAEEPQE